MGDKQSLLSSLKENEFFKAFQDQGLALEAKMTVLDGAIHTLNSIQRKWVYLGTKAYIYLNFCKHHYHRCEHTVLFVALQELKIEFKEIADFLFDELERRLNFWFVTELHHVKTELGGAFNKAI